MNCSSDWHGGLKIQRKIVYRSVPEGGDTAGKEKFPGLIAIEDIQVAAQILAGLIILLMIAYSAKIYKWEVRLMYGRVFCKLQETISEMEKLKQG